MFFNVRLDKQKLAILRSADSAQNDIFYRAILVPGSGSTTWLAGKSSCTARWNH